MNDFINWLKEKIIPPLLVALIVAAIQLYVLVKIHDQEIKHLWDEMGDRVSEIEKLKEKK